MTVTRITADRPLFEPLVTKGRRVTLPSSDVWAVTVQLAPRGAMATTGVSVSAQLVSLTAGLVTGQWLASAIATVIIVAISIVTLIGCAVTARSVTR